jgi:serine phosphatase RsbU (regulator of sigma subunit)
VFFSDGAYEAASPAGELFGVPRLLALVAAAGGGPTGDLAGVLAGLERWRGGARAKDDMTFLVIARES